MRVVFLGTPQFAVPTLEALLSAGHAISAVFTQPDRPKGRGKELAESPVKRAAMFHGLSVLQPERIRRPENVDLLRKINPDAMVVVGYGQIIPQSIIDIPQHGILNVHASLLPKYRGAAPIQWAIANGETVTGVTIMRIDAGLDTGDMLLHESTPIGDDETSPELGARLAVSGASLLVRALADVESGRSVAVKQNDAEASLAPILKKEDGLIDWSRSASQIYNRLRGFTPWPGIYTFFRGQTFQIASARVASSTPSLTAATLYPEQKRLFVGCGHSSAVELLEVQLPGKKRMPVEAFLNGYHLTKNEVLGVRSEEMQS
ncbi:MAG: methionyl-tRNA formyltransferase [Bryobacteraceae bacterium]